MSIGKKVLILLLALFVGAAIGFGYWYYHNVSTHTIREENFSVELPRSLEKATTIDYAAQSSDGTVKAIVKAIIETIAIPRLCRIYPCHFNNSCATILTANAVRQNIAPAYCTSHKDTPYKNLLLLY